MRKRNSFGVASLAILFFVACVFTNATKASSAVLFSDDFNDGVIDQIKWPLILGNGVTEEDGYMKLSVIDGHPYLYSEFNIPVNGQEVITVTRKVYLHSGGNTFIGYMWIYPGEGIPRPFGIAYANNAQCRGNGFFILKNNQNDPCQADWSQPIPGVWDAWFDEKIEYDPISGLLQYFINNQKVNEFNVGALPSEGTSIRLMFQTWGFWEGQYQYFDDLLVYQGLLPKEGITQLIENIIKLNLQQGITNSLDSKLGAAFNALDDANEQNDIAAINSLNAFINAVEAQRGNKISNSQADSLIAAAQSIISKLSQ